MLKKLEKERCYGNGIRQNRRLVTGTKNTAPNRQFGASGGVVSWDTSQDFGCSPPVQALPIPPPAAKLLKRWVPAGDTTAESSRENFV